MDLGHILAVSLDGRPLADSSRILLQVMSEEKESNRQTQIAAPNVQRLTNIGTDPWLVKELKGTVKFKRPDAGQLRVTALDFNGYPRPGAAGGAERIELQAQTVYYLIRQAQPR